MTRPWNSSSYHLRVFAFSLGAVFLALLGILFGVRMEAITHAAGVVEIRDVQEVRAPFDGLVQLGWFEGEVFSSGTPVHVRLDRQGNGITDPFQGESRKIVAFKCPASSTDEGDGMTIFLEQLSFHKLQADDVLWADQPLALVNTDKLNRELARLRGRLDDLAARKEVSRETLANYQSTRELLARGSVTAPTESPTWRVLKVCASSGQAIEAGELLAVLAPIDPNTNHPHAWIAQLEMSEKHAAGVEPGQHVRLFSGMYNHRLHGHAKGVVECVEPMAEAGPGGERRFHAQVKITRAPFTLRHGTSVKAEIVFGLKRVYRIILEQ